MYIWGNWGTTVEQLAQVHAGSKSRIQNASDLGMYPFLNHLAIMSLPAVGIL